MVRHREIEAKQLQDRADQPLGLAQRQAEHHTECQGSGNRQIGVAGLTAPTGAWLSLPGLYRLGRKPHGQATPGTQARIVRCPVGDLVSLLRNVMPAVAVGFERHGRRPSTIEGSPPYQPTRGRPPRRPVQQRVADPVQPTASYWKITLSANNHKGSPKGRVNEDKTAAVEHLEN